MRMTVCADAGLKPSAAARHMISCMHCGHDHTSSTVDLSDLFFPAGLSCTVRFEGSPAEAALVEVCAASPAPHPAPQDVSVAVCCENVTVHVCGRHLQVRHCDVSAGSTGPLQASPLRILSVNWHRVAEDHYVRASISRDSCAGMCPCLHGSRGLRAGTSVFVYGM